MHRIVHIDLKGAPPEYGYLEQVLRCIKIWGATGILLEWEDTFPYTANLVHLGSVTNAGGDGFYRMGDVQRILKLCKEIELEVIQLVQTVGHMEFVLKHLCHKRLREFARSTAVICPTKLDSKKLVREMITQMLAVQPDANYFHIGADEVWYLGVCSECSRKVKEPEDKWRIYLEYIKEMALFVKDQRPNITVLMWDDMLRSMSPAVLQEYNLSNIVQPVVWNYEVQENFMFPEGMWDMYIEIFPTVWAGSAYKGANGSNQMVSPVKRYVSNQEAWLAQMDIQSAGLNFAGVILTGWSRYDHFATMCELLVTSINSLYNCLKCYVGPETSPQDLYRDDLLPENRWPGVGLAKSIRRFVGMLEADYRMLKTDVTTWVNPWQMETGNINNIQVENIWRHASMLFGDMEMLERCIAEQLCVVFGPRTVRELMRARVGPAVNALRHLTFMLERCLSRMRVANM